MPDLKEGLKRVAEKMRRTQEIDEEKAERITRVQQAAKQQGEEVRGEREERSRGE